MNTLQKMFKHFSLITRHKWVVFKLCCKVGEVKRGLLHDLSKYSWTEFSEGVKYFNGGHSPITECKKAEGYSKAWLHHKGRNKHHAEYWNDDRAPDPTPVIPYKYAVEMLCDKLAAGMVYEGKNWTKEYEYGYWNKEKDKIKMNDKTKDFITDALKQVADNGIDATFKKENIRSIYKKYCE